MVIKRLRFEELLQDQAEQDGGDDDLGQQDASFLLMMLTGMMGISTDQLPEALQGIAKVFPMTYISNDFADFWQGGSYNFMPYIQSCIFLGAVAAILVMYAQYRNRRVDR